MTRFFAVFHVFLRRKTYDICAVDRANEYLEVLGWWRSSSNSSSIKCLSTAESRSYGKYHNFFSFFFAIGFWVCPIDNRCTAGNCSNVILHCLALGKVPFWLVAVFAYAASYTTSLFRTSPPSRPHLLETRTAPTQKWSLFSYFFLTESELHALLFSNSVWVL